MYGAPELYLALDIDDVPGADSRGGGDPNRVAVAEPAKVGNGKSVDLADAFTAGVDQQRVALDGRRPSLLRRSLTAFATSPASTSAALRSRAQ